MQRKFRITVDGHAYEVVVEEILGEASTLPAGVSCDFGGRDGGGPQRPPIAEAARAPATKSRRSAASWLRST